MFDGTLPKALVAFYTKDIERNMETIYYKILLLNLMRHDETEKSRIVDKHNDEDYIAFMKNIAPSVNKLPKKNVADPIMIWIGAKIGDIVSTKRIYESSGFLDIYELVIFGDKDYYEEE